MICNVVSIEKKQASNGNWYVTVSAQPANDPWAEELTYRMWCSEQLADKLCTNKPNTIELARVKVDVAPFKRVTDDGEILDVVCNALTVTCRQFQGQNVDDPEVMASKLRRQLLNEGRLVDVTVDAFCGGTSAEGELPV